LDYIIIQSYIVTLEQMLYGKKMILYFLCVIAETCPGVVTFRRSFKLWGWVHYWL